MAKATIEAETVRVRIQARQVVHYNQIVEMSRDEWNELKESEEERAADAAMGWIDTRDVYDADPVEPEDFEAIVVTDDGIPVSPRDEYGK